jgi:hypothetical protein
MSDEEGPRVLIYRQAILAPRGRKRTYNHMVARYVDWGEMEPSSLHVCLICSNPAQLWHHPSYAEGHIKWVQPLCVTCHNKAHSYAEWYFIAHPYEDFCSVAFTFDWEGAEDAP